MWGDRTTRVGSHPHIQYVLPFENRGAEVGVTLHHPHGQIYSYPFVPSVPARMLAQERDYYQQHGSSMLCDMARDEAADGKRVLYQDDFAIAFVPACARYPYEVWVMPTGAVQGFCRAHAAAARFAWRARSRPCCSSTRRCGTARSRT